VRGSPHPLAGLVLLVAGGLAGCGASELGTAPPLVFSGPAAEEVASVSGLLVVGVRWSPDPPAVGLAASELTVTDTTGAPVTGLTLTVVPWMPAHGHGSSTKPGVSETAPGVYVATPISFYMPGQWELRTTISGTGAADDMVTPSFAIP
jgi:hypothetical protein